MADTFIDYSKSPKMGKQEMFTGIGLDQNGRMTYDSASAEGMVEVVLPAANGPHGEVRMLAKDFGRHVAQEVERSLRPNPYPVASPRRNAVDTLWHYAGAAKGAQLMDDAGIRHLESLAGKFEAAPDKEKFYSQELKSYLLGLKPQRRQS